MLTNTDFDMDGEHAFLRYMARVEPQALAESVRARA
jgi:hypothetical protein